MRRRCKNCRWWQNNEIGKNETCNCVDSDMRFDETDAEYSCGHWIPEIEADGDATWIFTPEER